MVKLKSKILVHHNFIRSRKFIDFKSVKIIILKSYIKNLLIFKFFKNVIKIHYEYVVRRDNESQNASLLQIFYSEIKAI